MRTTTSEAKHLTSKRDSPAPSPTLTSTTTKGPHKKKKHLNLFLVGVAKQDKLKKLMKLISRKQGGHAKFVPVQLSDKRPRPPSRARRPFRRMRTRGRE
ncbi:hypothetical protein AAVH_05729 [Aphelenchoides avenae]|nr:hypothetical protein AAVH_05729 [Aphelenchus avenae]